MSAGACCSTQSMPQQFGLSRQVAVCVSFVDEWGKCTGRGMRMVGSAVSRGVGVGSMCVLCVLSGVSGLNESAVFIF